MCIVLWCCSRPLGCIVLNDCVSSSQHDGVTLRCRDRASTGAHDTVCGAACIVHVTRRALPRRTVRLRSDSRIGSGSGRRHGHTAFCGAHETQLCLWQVVSKGAAGAGPGSMQQRYHAASLRVTSVRHGDHNGGRFHRLRVGAMQQVRRCHDACQSSVHLSQCRSRCRVVGEALVHEFGHGCRRGGMGHQRAPIHHEHRGFMR